MRALDPWKVSLAGTTLIEASAGTGKTYTLTTLYLRMLVEYDLLPSQILVVTYTQAATAELRERLRARIRDAIRVGEAEHTDGGSDRASKPDVDEDLRRLALDARRRVEATGRPDALRRALQEFDEAAIFTIHGFCQRMLSQSAFESQVAFDAELIESSDLLLEGVARDLWANAIAAQDESFVDWLLRGDGRKRWQFNPAALKHDILGALGADEDMPVLPSIETMDDAPDEAPDNEAIAAVWQSWASAWALGRERVLPWLLDGDALNQTTHKKKTIEETWLPAFDELQARIESEGDAFEPGAIEMPKFWEKLTAEGIAKGVKKNREALDDPLFDAFSKVSEVMAALAQSFHFRALRLRYAFVAAARAEAKRRRDHDHRLLFDDLLSEVRRALRLPTGAALATRLREQFPFALIDEFQDTDPVQYEIFRDVWHRADAQDDSGLILIGDPKQAIYSFRGADLFTYLGAKRDAGDEVYGLGVNWRSTPSFVEVVNALFSRVENAFGFVDLDFESVSASPAAAKPLDLKGQAAPGLRVLLADRATAFAQIEKVEPTQASPDPASSKKKKGKQKPKELPLRFGRTRMMEAVARDIADLLDRGAKIDERPVRPSDIAVLCRTKRELARIRSALEDLAIPCVDRGESNVFDSTEAWEMLCVLRAIQRPGDPARVRAAFATSAGGVQASTLARWTESSEELTGASERFSNYARFFKESGFVRAFEAFRRREGVTSRLLALGDGERRLTNWLHLAELLQAVADRRNLTVAGLANWLERAIADEALRAEVGGDASLLRLERDDEAISLITLHRSKGLEFEIVYLPCLWESASRRDAADDSSEDDGKLCRPVRFHHEELGLRVLDLGSPEHKASVASERDEAWAEGLRLLYVALTRAKRQCVVAWGSIGPKYTKTALAWLLAEADAGDENRSREDVAHAIRLFEDSDWERLWLALGKAAGANSVLLEPAIFAPRPRWRAPVQLSPPLEFRANRRAIPRARITTSFSGLVRNARFSLEPASPDVIGRDLDSDVDRGMELERGVSEAPVEANLSAAMDQFPKGAAAGTLLHEVLEQVTFSALEPERIDELALAALERNGLPSTHASQIRHVVESVAQVPLAETAGSVSLAEIARDQFLAEMEFTLDAGSRSAAGGFSPSGLAAILRKADANSPLFHYADRAAGLSWRVLRGYLRGFIDATFCDGERYFLIDYKSNFLGSQQADYRADRLLMPMIEHDYVLQYLIYSVALDRHLERTLAAYDYEKNFGGAYYLYLRGLSVEHEKGCGVFFDRPALEIIRAVRELLDGDDETRAPVPSLAPTGQVQGSLF